jgi:hypothetical protein
VARVTAVLAFTWTELPGYMISIAADGVNQLAFTGGFIVRHGRFYQVPGAVQFVHVAQVCPALLWFDNSVVCVQSSGEESGVTRHFGSIVKSGGA